MGIAECYQQEKATIYGHNIFHYLVCTDIGDIHIVQFEDENMELKTEMFLNDNRVAEKCFKRFCNRILNIK